MAGQRRAARITRYPIDSGLVKFGVTPAGGGYAPTTSVVEFVMGARHRFIDSSSDWWFPGMYEVTSKMLVFAG